LVIYQMQVRSVNAYRSLLVYCDGTPESDEAVLAASEMARRDRARLMLVAVAQLERPRLGCGIRTGTWNDVLRDAACADLERAVRLLDCPAHSTVLCGEPNQAIADYAAELGVDAIMLPPAPRRGVSRRLGRDRAATIRRLASCAVVQPR
jgi:nucleotide-binding universal stress UspA family protein